MCIYCNTKNYRKIYENHVGSIPIEENDRSYEIHHIDGNHTNNDPTNLKAVTIQEHYDIHYAQSDWLASYRIGQRLLLHPKILSDLLSAAAKERVAKGIHHFTSEFATSINKKRVSQGTHNLLGPSHNQNLINQNTHHFLGDSNPVFNLIKNGTHIFLGDNNPSKLKIKDGSHNFLKQWECTNCGKNGTNMGNYYRWHGNKCNYTK
jgi:ribosomal protein S27AE